MYISMQGYKGGPVSGAPVPGVVNVHRVIIPVDRPKSSASSTEEHKKRKKNKTKKDRNFSSTNLL